jgi:hypothetical protein
MTPFQLGALILTVTTIGIAWTRGGHPERLGACAVLIWITTTTITPDSLHSIRVADISVLEVALEFTLLVVLVRMALTGRRWWPFAAAAVTALGVMVYGAQLLIPEVDRRAEISAHVGLGLALDLTILTGVVERWLAGERPASLSAVWARRQHET